jgi:hypothetical protein
VHRGMVAGSEKGQMNRSKKIPWDDGFYMARTDPERERKPQIKPGKPLKLESEPCDIGALTEAWAAVGVRFDVVRFMDDLARLDQWERRER